MRAFFLSGLEPNWEYVLAPVMFYNEGNFVDITFASSEGPITFEKGLLFSDAPEPGFDFC